MTRNNRADEVLPDQCRTDHDTVAGDGAAIGRSGEGHLADTGDGERIGKPRPAGRAAGVEQRAGRSWVSMATS